jgi:allophanate hydrolase subunit 1
MIKRNAIITLILLSLITQTTTPINFNWSWLTNNRLFQQGQAVYNAINQNRIKAITSVVAAVSVLALASKARQLYNQNMKKNAQESLQSTLDTVVADNEWITDPQKYKSVYAERDRPKLLVLANAMQPIFESIDYQDLNPNMSNTIDKIQPIHIAVLLLDPQNTAMLLKRGAKASLETTFGMKPLDILTDPNIIPIDDIFSDLAEKKAATRSLLVEIEGGKIYKKDYLAELKQLRHTAAKAFPFANQQPHDVSRIQQLITEHPALINQPIYGKSDINSMFMYKDPIYRNALHLAIRTNNLEMANFLLDQKNPPADLFAVNKYGQTPLDAANDFNPARTMGLKSAQLIEQEKATNKAIRDKLEAKLKASGKEEEDQ